ncbi:calcium-binding protein [Tropicimonas sediminicola]|uniref:Hemolysin-type calcium-binding repeat-containing protein n=1 Tax=Tropicimonas sediminicola TaxID=1031541 RepID=A0A239FY32_9RHOB|nr:calcium-binding protein [Tropicimonas sediminicola]SNS60684.1 Hemolysin-type calcium-binding repeat-containing protein [Tropicimonas sediminicola]
MFDREIIGTSNDDTLVGTDRNDNLVGLLGNDLLIGGKGKDRLDGNELSDTFDGADELRGGRGNDLMIASWGADLFNGGPGRDTVSYAHVGFGVDISLTVPVIVGGFTQGHTFRSIEILVGTRFNDNLTGDEFDNVLKGGGDMDGLNGADGDDRLFGGKGNDVLRGDGGADYMNGGAGNDRLIDDETVASNDVMIGGKGNDDLRGGLGKTTMKGGAGNDVLVVETGSAIMTGGRGADEFRFVGEIGKARVKDFRSGQDDVLHLQFLQARNFEDVLQNSRTKNGDLIISLDDARIVIDDLTKTQLDTDMFLFS